MCDGCRFQKPTHLGSDLVRSAKKERGTLGTLSSLQFSALLFCFHGAVTASALRNLRGFTINYPKRTLGVPWQVIVEEALT